MRHQPSMLGDRCGGILLNFRRRQRRSLKFQQIRVSAAERLHQSRINLLAAAGGGAMEPLCASPQLQAMRQDNSHLVGGGRLPDRLLTRCHAPLDRAENEIGMLAWH